MEKSENGDLFDRKMNYSTKVYIDKDREYKCDESEDSLDTNIEFERIYFIEKYIGNMGKVTKQIIEIENSNFDLENLDLNFLSLSFGINIYIHFKEKKYLLRKIYLTPWIINGELKNLDEIELLSKNSEKYLKLLNMMKNENTDKIYESNNYFYRWSNDSLTLDEYKEKKLIK